MPRRRLAACRARWTRGWNRGSASRQATGERAIKAWLFWTLVARGQFEAAIELSEDPSLAGDHATMLYEVRVLGYPIGKETLVRALRDGSTTADDGMAERPSDWTSSTPAIFERGAYAAER